MCFKKVFLVFCYRFLMFPWNSICLPCFLYSLFFCFGGLHCSKEFQLFLKVFPAKKGFLGMQVVSKLFSMFCSYFYLHWGFCMLFEVFHWDCFKFMTGFLQFSMAMAALRNHNPVRCFFLWMIPVVMPCQERSHPELSESLSPGCSQDHPGTMALLSTTGAASNIALAALVHEEVHKQNLETAQWNGSFYDNLADRVMRRFEFLEPILLQIGRDRHADT